MNIHLCSGDNLAALLEDDFTQRCPSIFNAIEQSLTSASSELTSVNLMLFNQSLSVKEIALISKFCSGYRDKKIFLSLLASPTHITSYKQLCKLKEAGIYSIAFHSYHQYIIEKEYNSYAELAAWAEKLKMPILIDGSYGTLDIYNIDNLKFTAYLASFIKHTPIVIVHSGGARVLEAMLLVHATSNIFLETSFTLPYYANSSIEQDLAFAYKKVGPEKILYASDYPYVSHNTALSSTLNFLDKFSFSSRSKEWIMRNTFSQIFDI